MMSRLRWAASLAAFVALAGPAFGQWSVRKAGDFDTVATRLDARGDELFFFCSNTGLGIGMGPTFPNTPNPAIGNMAKIRVTLSFPGQPTATLPFESYAGGYWAPKGFTPAMAASVRGGSGTVAVTILPPESQGLNNPEQSFDLAGIGTAFAKAKWPKRCR